MAADPLSDILDLADARCVMSGTLIAGGAWGRAFKRTDAVKFLAVVKGNCWLKTEDDSVGPIGFCSGDVLITNGAPALVMGSAANELTAAVGGPQEKDAEGNLRAGEGDNFVLIGGLLEVDERRCRFLREGLPSVIHVSGRQSEAAKLRWLLTELAEEMQRRRAGSATAVTHLAKLMFVEALRLHIRDAKSGQAGWLTALEDRRISLALRAVHADPPHPWTLDALAKLSGMSRTSFAVTFREIVGVPPLTYVLNWRMRLAERSLAETDHSIADVAWSVGYGSESAFSNAFSRATGVSPGRFRRDAMQMYPMRRRA